MSSNNKTTSTTQTTIDFDSNLASESLNAAAQQDASANLTVDLTSLRQGVGGGVHLADKYLAEKETWISLFGWLLPFVSLELQRVPFPIYPYGTRNALGVYILLAASQYNLKSVLY